MSDHAEFLAAIIDHPDDDGPREVYADWLDEQGDPRGEFVRIQCELAGFATPICSLQCGDCLKCVLHRRERELLDQYAGVWTDFLPESLTTKPCPACEDQSPDYETNVVECRQCDSTGLVPDADNYEFRRGFVEWIALPWETFATHHAAIRSATPLKVVELANNPSMQSNPHMNKWRLYYKSPFDGPFFQWLYIPSVHANGRWQDALLALLAAEFPGLTFELPENDPPSTTDFDRQLMPLLSRRTVNPAIVTLTPGALTVVEFRGPAGVRVPSHEMQFVARSGRRGTPILFRSQANITAEPTQQFSFTILEHQSRLLGADHSPRWEVWQHYVGTRRLITRGVFSIVHDVTPR